MDWRDGDLPSSCDSREAKLQVEIARLKYVSPRLREALAGASDGRAPARASPISISIAARSFLSDLHI
jgi:GTP-binding GTPase Middle Region